MKATPISYPGTKVWECLACRYRYPTRTEAEECCSCRTCGLHAGHHERSCQSCRKAERAQAYQDRIAAYPFVEWNGPVLDEDGDDFAVNSDELAERLYDEGLTLGEIQRRVVLACDVVKLRVPDLEDFIMGVWTEDSGEDETDWYLSDKTRKLLREAQAFAAAGAPTVWKSRKERVDMSGWTP